MTRRRLILVFATVLAVLSGPVVAALSELTQEELDQNRRLLERIRSDPEHYRRLRRDLKSFNRLRPELQTRLRQLDRDLRAELSGTQVRLLHAAEQYAQWLQRLTPEQRQTIAAAPTSEARVERIKALRRTQWAAQLPEPQRQQVERLPAPEREELTRRLRAEELARQLEWDLAERYWDSLNRPKVPQRLADLVVPVQSFVRDYIRPQLTPEEERLLDSSQGSGLFLFVLMQLLDKYPVLLPGPKDGPRYFKDLPRDLQEQLAKQDADSKKRLVDAEGKWPTFAIAVSEFAQMPRNRIKLSKQLGPSRPEEFSEAWQAVFARLADPQTGLSKEEQQQLAAAQGRWPRYPRTLLILALKHNLKVPEGAALSLPGNSLRRWIRDAARADREEKPMVSDLVLWTFARSELQAEEWATTGASLTDRVGRQRLQDLYISRHREEWLKVQLSDQQKKSRRD